MLSDVRELADFCDVFCEEGAFTSDESKEILQQAANLGFGLKIHADEFGDTGGGKLAADTTFPFLGGDLSVGGELGFGRDKSNVDYKGQPIDWLSNVGETKLGDNWNVGFKWRKKFAGGGMGRRAFLKLMAALGLTGAGAKYASMVQAPCK